MVIVENNALNPDFLGYSALQNARAILKALFPKKNVRSRSTSGLMELLDADELQVTPAEFTEAMWSLMEEGYKGSYHLCLAALTPFLESQAPNQLPSAVERWRALPSERNRIDTGTPLDATWMQGEKDASILYIGEAAAELFDKNESYEEVRHGVPYTFRAYKHMNVPVLSKINVGTTLPYVSIITRAIHQGVTPVEEAAGLREFLVQNLGTPFPPLGGISEGIKALWGTKITPRRFDAEEPDGSKVNLTCAPGAKNPSSEELESILKNWDFKKGSLLFDQTTFRVDVGKAIFSFGSNVPRDHAYNVISAIISAAP